MKSIVLLLALLACSASAISSDQKPIEKRWNGFRITLYASDGKEIRHWKTRRYLIDDGRITFTDDHGWRVATNGTFVAEDEPYEVKKE